MNSGFPRELSPLLERLCDPATPAEEMPRAAFVLAHPDDETVGASYLVSRLPQAEFIYITDGAPRDGHDAQAAGFTSVGAYARARQRELRHALPHVSRDKIHFLEIADQEVAEQMSAVARELVCLLRRCGAEVVITHPYEGGHPDHDATAFAVHSAQATLKAEGSLLPLIVEMTSYHNVEGSFHFGDFLDSEEPILQIPLEGAARSFKEQMIAAYPTQERVLRSVIRDHESYRVAPRYDFSHPPQAGKLLYELFSWKMTGARWRRLALAAIEELRLETSLSNEEVTPGHRALGQ